ncbi:response regulator transcription factor [Streptomyces sp. NPDC003011]
MHVVLEPRTLRVVELIAAGVSRLDISGLLRVSESIVSREVDRACHVLLVGRNQHAGLVDTAIREGVISLPALAPRPLEEYLLDTLQWIARGYTNPEIGAELWLSVDAVKSRVKRILRALDAENRAHAVAIGWQRGLLPVESVEAVRVALLPCRVPPAESGLSQQLKIG